MTSVRVAVTALSVCSCVAALSTADVNSLHDSQRLDLEIYNAAGAKTVAGALARAAFCSDEAVLRRNDASLTDSKGAIECQPQK
jgi:hypothetical protein